MKNSLLWIRSENTLQCHRKWLLIDLSDNLLSSHQVSNQGCSWNNNLSICFHLCRRRVSCRRYNCHPFLKQKLLWQHFCRKDGNYNFHRNQHFLVSSSCWFSFQDSCSYCPTLTLFRSSFASHSQYFITIACYCKVIFIVFLLLAF